MENSTSSSSNTQATGVIVALTVVVAITAIIYFYQGSTPEPVADVVKPEAETTVVEVSDLPVPDTQPEVKIDVIEPATTTETEPVVVAEVAPEKVLPQLDESDDWIRAKLPEITWRNELLKLIIDDDMIRRFVVFTDNFAKGTLAYEHSFLVQPTGKFSAKESDQADKTILVWDESVTKRFTLYVDLLRTVDSDLLVEWYVELKPLIDQAYSELGYPDTEFAEVLHEAITRVLDMEIPKEPLELVRPSVMYKYKDQDIEQLSDADKLLLRIGKDNLLVIKSVLLEITEKLSRTRE